MTKILAVCLTIMSYCLLFACSNKTISTTSNNESQPIEGSTKKHSIVAKLKENAQLPVEERIALYHNSKRKILMFTTSQTKLN
jgi:hypothetical protein